MKINENYIVFPDGTDESANFRGETITTDSGETMYLAPVRVQTEDDLKTFGVGKEARWTLPFGKSSEKYKVLYFATPSRELAEEFWEKINTQHSQEYRKRRCMIPGKLKPLIPCPDCNSCAHCPYPEYRDKHEAREISYNDKLNAQKITPKESPEIRKLELTWMIQGACRKMDEQNPLFAKAIILKAYNGYTVPEIAQILHCTEYDVRYYLWRAVEIGKEFKREYYCRDE